MANDLATKLHDAWAQAPKGEVVVRVHLFGIEHASELEGTDLGALAEAAGIPVSLATEVRKGIKLALFVTVKERAHAQAR